MPSYPAVAALNPTWSNDTGGANFYGTQGRADASDPLWSAQYAALMSPNEAPPAVSDFLGGPEYPLGSNQNPMPTGTDPLTQSVRPGVPLFAGQPLGSVPRTTGPDGVTLNPLTWFTPHVLQAMLVAVIALMLIYVGLQTAVKNDILQIRRAA